MTKTIVKMSLLALAVAYDSDSDLSDSEDENKVEKEVNKQSCKNVPTVPTSRC